MQGEETGEDGSSTQVAQGQCPTCKAQRQCIYFIGTASGHIKIGIVNDPMERLRALQTGHHEPLTLLGAWDCEADGINALEYEDVLHEMFEPWHLRGEWFGPPARVVAPVKMRAWIRMRYPQAWERWWSYDVRSTEANFAELPGMQS